MRPTIQLNTSAGRQEISLSSLHLTKRRIFLTGSIDDDLANDVIQELLWLDSESQDPIDIYINSPGGSVTSGLAIYDILQMIESPVNMICCGLAASMASILFASGEKGHRFIYPHSRVMVHEAYIAGGVGGSAMSIQNTAEEMLKTQKIVYGILSQHTGKSVDEIAKALSYDHFMNAEESIEFGICDEIITPAGKES